MLALFAKTWSGRCVPLGLERSLLAASSEPSAAARRQEPER